MTALPRLQQALERRMAEPPPRRLPLHVLGTALVVAIAVTVAVFAARGPRDVEIPAATQTQVAVGEPVSPPVRAGDPPDGQIELSAVAPNGARLEALYFTDGKGPCLEIGLSTTIRKYPVEEGGSCVERALADLPVPLTPGVSSATGMPTVVSGFARPDVEAIEVAGLGGRSPVPISEHRAWFVSYPSSARGRVVLTAHLHDGSQQDVTVSVPPESAPPVAEGPGQAGDRVLPLIRP
jgi:hypothetical protein